MNVPMMRIHVEYVEPKTSQEYMEALCRELFFDAMFAYSSIDCMRCSYPRGAMFLPSVIKYDSFLAPCGCEVRFCAYCSVAKDRDCWLSGYSTMHRRDGGKFHSWRDISSGKAMYIHCGHPLTVPVAG